MGKVKSQGTGTKWEKLDFLKAFYMNRGDVHQDWTSFYSAMSDACLHATGSVLSENSLSMRCGSVKAQASKNEGQAWEYPQRPSTAAPKEPTMWELMQRIEAGEIDLVVDAKK